MGLNHFVKENYEALQKIFDSVKVGIWITDGEGNVVFINEESAKTGGLKKEDLIGKNMKTLLEMGYILYDSSVLRALDSKEESSIVQELGEGGHLYATSIPITEDNHISLVVCTERDITETINLRELLKEQEELAEKYQSELAHLRKQEIKEGGEVVTQSPIMHNVIGMATRAAKLDVTVMLAGESGTGKELIANMIYENSNRKNKPFIKVNCAAIPESLMESEFFGYVKGSFTGANQEGKIGFFELANHGNVEFENVKFGYLPDKPVIRNFSAKIKAGQQVAIVGPTGAGKTTLVNLLMRFYEVDQGEIRVDGVPIDQVPRENIHAQFGMVLQDTWLFEGTIKENIIYCKEGITDEQVVSACKSMGLHHFIMTLPDGYDTILSDKASLSEGQKQLITIARAMIQNAPLLILDEATSSVDTRTERIVQSAMEKLTEGRTSFIIAHRLSTIKNADLILVMRDGDIVESGSHEELLAQQGFYAELYNSQFEKTA